MALFDSPQPDLSLLSSEELSFYQRYMRPMEQRVQDLEEELREREPEARFNQLAPERSRSGGPAQAQKFQVLSTSQDVGVTHAVLSWVQPRSPEVVGYELWVSGLTQGVPEPVFLREVSRAPAAIQLNADTNVVVTVYLVPKLRDGRQLSPDGSPSVTIDITQSPLTAEDIPDGSIGDSKLDRTTDPIVVTNADIANATIQSAKIANLDAAKINAGILAAGVILTENINATQINAGTMTAVNVDAGTYTLTSGANQMQITGTNGFRQVNTSGTSDEVRIIDGEIYIENSSSPTSSSQTILGKGSLDLDFGGNSGIRLSADGTSGDLILGTSGAGMYGTLDIWDGSGNQVVNVAGNDDFDITLPLKFGGVSTPSGEAGHGKIWYNNSAGKLQGRDNTGSVYDLNSGGGSSSSGTSGLVQLSDGSGGFNSDSTFSFNTTTNILTVQDISASDDVTVDGDLVARNGSAVNVVTINGLGTSSSGQIIVDNSSGTEKVKVGTNGTDGYVEFNNNGRYALMQSSAIGKRLACGLLQFTGTASSDSVSTGLSSIDCFVATAIAGSAPASDSAASKEVLVTGSPSGGTITVYRNSSSPPSGRFYYWMAFGDD